MGTIDYEEYLMNTLLLQPEVQQIINDNLYADLHALLLSQKEYNGVPIKEIVQQIECKKKTIKKLPTWFKTSNILYNEKINIEQTSSEITAIYKAQLFSGKKMIDLTAGFGIDAYYFAKQFESVVLCELNNELLKKVQHNYQQLHVSNALFHIGDGLKYLQSQTQSVDLIYLDPARRLANQKVFLLEDCMPNVVEAQPLLLEKSQRVLIKLSPLFDLTEITRKLQCVKRIYCIAVKNEMKEVLVELERNYQGESTIICENLETLQPRYEFSINTQPFITYANTVEKFIYEPSTSIYKAGTYDAVAAQFQLKKLAPHSHIYTSTDLHTAFPGKILKVTTVLKPQPKTIKKALQATHYNIIARNYPLKVSEIKKKYKLQEGGTAFLLFTQLGTQKVILLCERCDVSL